MTVTEFIASVGNPIVRRYVSEMAEALGGGEDLQNAAWTWLSVLPGDMAAGFMMRQIAETMLRRAEIDEKRLAKAKKVVRKYIFEADSKRV